MLLAAARLLYETVQNLAFGMCLSIIFLTRLCKILLEMVAFELSFDGLNKEASFKGIRH